MKAGQVSIQSAENGYMVMVSADGGSLFQPVPPRLLVAGSMSDLMDILETIFDEKRQPVPDVFRSAWPEPPPQWKMKEQK